MSNKDHGSRGVMIYLCLLLVVVIINMLDEINILNVIYFITLIGCLFRYMMVSKE